MTNKDMNNQKQKDNLSDPEIQRLLSSLPDGDKNPWFLRKVMNRLPQPTGNRHSPIVVIAYMISFAILFGAWIYAAASIFTPSSVAITYSDIIYLVSLIILTTVLPLSYQSASR